MRAKKRTTRNESESRNVNKASESRVVDFRGNSEGSGSILQLK